MGNKKNLKDDLVNVEEIGDTLLESLGCESWEELMTSRELEEHFTIMGIESELVNSWNKVSQMADKAKYANYIPPIDQFNADKEGYIKLITSFNKVRTES